MADFAPVTAPQDGGPVSGFTRYQKLVVGLMAFLQFTIMLDFMIISPLGAILMPSLHITPSQFGLVVSVYAFSAGVSGFLASGFADRFDRKRMLLFFYVGFILGTLFCGLANSYEMLLLARLITGLFGGVIGSIVLAITTDLFTLDKRGRVIGYLQTAFAASQILGIPAGLYLSNNWGWHAPFMMIVVCGAIAGVIIWNYLQPVNSHLQLQKRDHNPFHHMWQTVSNPKYILAFATTAFLSLGGFMLMPFSSAFAVNNLGINMHDLPLIYLITGLFSIVIGPLVGRASDVFGKFRVFMFGAILTVVMVVIYTNMGVSPIWMVVLVNVLMFIGIFSRMIPSQALTSAIPTPDKRGSFMAISSSLQQVSGGLASVVAGLIVVEASDGKILHFDTLGYILCGTAIITVFMVYSIQKTVMTSVQTAKNNPS